MNDIPDGANGQDDLADGVHNGQVEDGAKLAHRGVLKKKKKFYLIKSLTQG